MLKSDSCNSFNKIYNTYTSTGYTTSQIVAASYL